MVKHHYVVIENADGVVEHHRMKQWLRDNPKFMPKGLNPEPRYSNPQKLRSALKKQGWRLEMLSDKVLLYGPPNGKEPPGSSKDALVIEAAGITFGLERDLQSALRANIDQLEIGLKIVDGGKERNTEAGEIDITAADTKGNIVVIELKAGTAQPEAVTQVLAYMGAVADVDKLPVRGILVAGDFHKRVIFASHAIPNLELRRYSFHFKFDSMK